MSRILSSGRILDNFRRLMRVDIEHATLRMNMSVLMAYRSEPCVFANMMKMVNTLFSYHIGDVELHSDTFA